MNDDAAIKTERGRIEFDEDCPSEFVDLVEQTLNESEFIHALALVNNEDNYEIAIDEVQ